MHRKMRSPVYIMHSEGRAALFFFSPMPLCADIFFDFLLIACERMELLGPNSNHQMKEIHRESRKTE